MTESSPSPNIEDKVPEDVVRKTLDFNEGQNERKENESDPIIENDTNTDITQTDTKQDETKIKSSIHTPLKNAEHMTDKAVNFVLGDSNGLRIHMKDPDVKNISKTGQKAADIGTLLKIADAKASGKKVKNIIIHLGTNDISKCKEDSAQAMIAIRETHKQFPKAQITFSSIIPRKGKSPAIGVLNDSSKAVNDFIRKLAVKESYMCYLNNDSDITDNGVPIKSFYDTSDASGVHLSVKGADMLADSFQDFFNCGHVSDDDLVTPHTQKRNRSVLSNTPPSDKQVAKTNKIFK